MLHRQTDGVLRHHRLSRTGMSGHKDGIAHLEVVHCLLLERIQLEGVLYRRIRISGRQERI